MALSASTVRSLGTEWRAFAGERQSRALENTFNTYALAAGWQVRVVKGQVEQSLPADAPLVQRGETYAAALTSLLDLMVRQAGEEQTVRALQRAYDGLPWDQREVAAQYIFCDVRRAEALSRAFRSTQQSYRALLRRIPLFATMDEGDLDLLCLPVALGAGPAGPHRHPPRRAGRPFLRCAPWPHRSDAARCSRHEQRCGPARPR